MNDLIVGISIGVIIRSLLGKVVSEWFKSREKDKLKEEDIEICRLETIAETLDSDVLKAFIKKYKTLRKERLKYLGKP